MKYLYLLLLPIALVLHSCNGCDNHTPHNDATTSSHQFGSSTTVITVPVGAVNGTPIQVTSNPSIPPGPSNPVNVYFNSPSTDIHLEQSADGVNNWQPVLTNHLLIPPNAGTVATSTYLRVVMQTNPPPPPPPPPPFSYPNNFGDVGRGTGGLYTAMYMFGMTKVSLSVIDQYYNE